MDGEIEVDYSPFEEDEVVKEDTDAAGAAEDIYADLYDEQGEQGTILKSKNAALQEQCQQQETTIQKLRSKIEEITEENLALSDERKILIRNISCLYRTAREEMIRKDTELLKRASAISSLKEQVRLSRSHGSHQAGHSKKPVSPMSVGKAVPGGDHSPPPPPPLPVPPLPFPGPQ